MFDKASESDTPEVRQAAIRQMFNAYMYCPDEVAAKQLSSMIERLKSGQSSDPEMKELLLRLNDQYPGDPGVFAPLMLNFLRLKVGESFFIGANEPHAYISGDIIECMALSDNVVRAGLTPKLKDKDTLCSMLHYRYEIQYQGCRTIAFEFNTFFLWQEWAARFS